MRVCVNAGEALERAFPRPRDEADGKPGYTLIHTSFQSALYIGTSASSRSRAQNDDVPASSLAPAYQRPRKRGTLHQRFTAFSAITGVDGVGD